MHSKRSWLFIISKSQLQARLNLENFYNFSRITRIGIYYLIPNLSSWYTQTKRKDQIRNQITKNIQVFKVWLYETMKQVGMYKVRNEMNMRLEVLRLERYKISKIIFPPYALYYVLGDGVMLFLSINSSLVQLFLGRFSILFSFLKFLKCLDYFSLHLCSVILILEAEEPLLQFVHP